MFNPAQNKNLRVMSTPEWPVPYYKRAFRAPPAIDNSEIPFNILASDIPINDKHAIMAKEHLKTIGKGYVVEAVENHFDITKYNFGFEDSSEFSAAYVDDMLDSIDIAAKQNVKLMNDYDLSDCLKE